MKKKISLALLIVLAAIGSLFAHDMFLKFSSYFLSPNTEVTLALVNGTFDQSENAIARYRMLDVSIVGPNTETLHPDTTAWWDEDNTAWLKFQTGDAGTYVAGVSTAGRMIELSATEFNDYLAHDGVLDMIEERQEDGSFEDDAREWYAKHVKAVFQVGDAQTDTYRKVLGYPIEIVPLQNPYTLSKGEVLSVQVLRDGQPLVDQLVYASSEGFHGHDADGGHTEAWTTRTDAHGRARFRLNETGRWYVRLINMVKHPDADIDYESRWATLTFELQ